MLSPSGIVPLLGIRGIFVIEQNPDGRRVRVVMLSGSVGPKERTQKKQGNQHTATDQKKDNAHFLRRIKKNPAP